MTILFILFYRLFCGIQMKRMALICKLELLFWTGNSRGLQTVIVWVVCLIFLVTFRLENFRWLLLMIKMLHTNAFSSNQINVQLSRSYVFFIGP